MLCGQPRRLPTIRATASPAAPALTWTAVPPAKSRAPRVLAIQPPRSSDCPAASVSVKPSKLKTQCATGKYTRVHQPTAKAIQAQKRARSAIDPEMSAVVTTANMSWNMTKAIVGIWCPAGPDRVSWVSRSSRCEASPTSPR